MPGLPSIAGPVGLEAIQKAAWAKLESRADLARAGVVTQAKSDTFQHARALLRTAQAAMRHSKPELTANIYTDPKLLDIAGAIEALPGLEKGTQTVDAAT